MNSIEIEWRFLYINGHKHTFYNNCYNKPLIIIKILIDSPHEIQNFAEFREIHHVK